MNGTPGEPRALIAVLGCGRGAKCITDHYPSCGDGIEIKEIPMEIEGFVHDWDHPVEYRVQYWTSKSPHDNEGDLQRTLEMRGVDGWKLHTALHTHQTRKQFSFTLIWERRYRRLPSNPKPSFS